MDIIEEISGSDDIGEISGVAISSAGVVDAEEGKIVHAGPTIPDYTGVEFIRPVMEKFGIPCEIENDVNCAGLAEYTSGAGKNSSSMLCLTIGTGIGGCFVNEGNVLHGFAQSACEVGYMTMHGSAFEKLGAASILSKTVAGLKGDREENWSGIRIFEEVQKGDKDSIAAVQNMCDVLGEGIANICYILNPQVVVLGGGIMARQDYLLPRIRQSMDKYLIPYIGEKTMLKAASQGNNAGMIGAYYHFCTMQDKRRKQ